VCGVGGAVGAGTSGAVFASRLTEDEQRSVLVLEAGGDPFDDQNVNVPILADSVKGTEYDWQYHTVPQQQACLGHVNNVRHAAALSCSVKHISFCLCMWFAKTTDRTAIVRVEHTEERKATKKH